MRKTMRLRAGAAVITAALLCAAGTTMASAEVVDPGAGEDGAADPAGAEQSTGEQGVDVSVDIGARWEPGVLAMTIAQDSVALVEDGSSDLERRFLGTLPEVTVTDTRASGEQWYVTGVISDFAGADEASIGAEYFGWSPRLVADPGDATIEAGGDVDGELDGGPGLTDGWDLLYAAWDADAAAEARQGTFTADAGLELTVPSTVAPGEYSALLTLSLFD